MARYQIKAGGQYLIKVRGSIRTITVGSKPIPVDIPSFLPWSRSRSCVAERRDTGTAVLVLISDLEREVRHVRKG